jgi:hypothetical protein
VGNVRITPKYEENKKVMEYKGNSSLRKESRPPTKY